MTNKLPLPKKLPKWAYAIPLVVLLFAVGSLVSRLSVVANWPKVEGVVVEILERADTESDSGRSVYHDYPVFRYTDPEDESVQFTATTIESIGGLTIGDKLMIRIDPNDKSLCLAVGWWSTFGTPVIGFVATLFVLAMVIGARFAIPKLHELYDAGILVPAEK